MDSPAPRQICKHYRPAPVYKFTFMDFVTRVKTKDVNDEEGSAYEFMSGLQKPRFCNPEIGKDIPAHLRTTKTIENERTALGPASQIQNSIPTYKSPPSRWGIDMSAIKREIIPHNIHLVQKQQREMTPIMHWINNHPADFKRDRPQFASNRHVLKMIMAMNCKAHKYSFTAEKRNGTIYLREVKPAVAKELRQCEMNGVLFESVMLSSSGYGPDSNFDLNESTYGIFVGRIDNISFLFSAEIDGFWGTGLEKTDPTKKQLDDYESRIVELKSMHRDLFSAKSYRGRLVFKNKMAIAWVQSFLVGLDKILFGIIDDNNVGQLQVILMDEILEHLKKFPGYERANKKGFFTHRLKDSLTTILDHVTEESPVEYLVDVEHPPGALKNSTTVTKIMTDSTESTLAPQLC